MLFEGYLVEVLLSALLMLNSGAFIFLWRKIRAIEEDMDGTNDRIDGLESTMKDIWRRIFGSDEDETMHGHLVETEDRFDTIDAKLDEICGMIDTIDEKRRVEHQKVQDQMDSLIETISEEENFQADESDIRVD